MNLETIEQLSVNYLSQVSNPLVRIEVLFAHLRDRELAGDMDSARLKSFLERHPLFRVVPPLVDEASGTGPAAPGSAYVVLVSRTPSQAQVSVMMLDQLVILERALVSALAEARESEDEAQAARIGEALRRLGALRSRLEKPTPADSAN